MTVFEKLKIKIESETDYKVLNFQRTRIGWNLKSAGAWLWRCDIVDENDVITGRCLGSPARASDLVKQKTPFDYSGDYYTIEIN